jgi:hypothetical protein
MLKRVLPILAVISLAACGTPAAAPTATSVPSTSAPPPAETAATQPTATVASASTEATTTVTSEADLSGIKQYLQQYGKDYLKAGADTLKVNADQYYDAVKAADFDYQRAWGDGKTLRPLILNMRDAFNQSHTGYESVEGIVAGVPSLSLFDTILDAGSPGSDGGDNVADYSLTLPDGAKLDKPGNFFHNLLEPMIYGTDKDQTRLGDVDVDGDGKVGPGDALPDANRLKGVADSFVTYVDQTIAAIDGWQPTPADAFTAMVTMTPTMDEYFSNWKESRYVTGDTTTETRFVAHSRLVDVTQILASIRTIYGGVHPLVQAKDAATAEQIDKNYADLLSFVQSLLDKENGGTRYTPDQADVLGKQAQDQAQAITGQVTQAAALLGIPLESQ